VRTNIWFVIVTSNYRDHDLDHDPACDPDRDRNHQRGPDRDRDHDNQRGRDHRCDPDRDPDPDISSPARKILIVISGSAVPV
jgi:hypothetical protein